jgi:hypothetical protein
MKSKFLNEYKIVKTTHKYSRRPDKEAYAVVATSCLFAEPDAKDGFVSTEDPNDMYVIAHGIKEACMYVWEHFEVPYD